MTNPGSACEWPTEAPPTDTSVAEPASRDAELDAKRLITAKAWQRASDLRRSHFENGNNLFADPVWEMLLDLYVQTAESHKVSITDLCVAAKIPATTGLRWLDRLSRAGLIELSADRRDMRRIYLTLTA